MTEVWMTILESGWNLCEANGRGYQEEGVASGWNVWVWFVSVLVRRYIIDILIIIIIFPYTPLVLALFWAASSLFLCSFSKCFFVLIIYKGIHV